MTEVERQRLRMAANSAAKEINTIKGLLVDYLKDHLLAIDSPKGNEIANRFNEQIIAPLRVFQKELYDLSEEG